MKSEESEKPPPTGDQSGGEQGAEEQQEQDLTSMNLRTSVLSLAFPGAMRMGMHSLIAMVSLIIVGSLGAEAIAAIGVAKRAIQMATAVFQALSVGATATVARFIGAKDHQTARKVVSQAILFSIILGLIIAVVGIVFSPQMMRFMMILQDEPDQEVIQMGTIYLQMLAGSYVLAIALFMSNALLQGAGDMKTPLYLMTYMNLVNLVGAYVLVYGVGPFPAMGVAGAGLAAGLARASAGAIAIWVLATDKSVVGMNIKELMYIDWGLLKAIVNVGFPAAVENFVRRGSQIIYTMLIASMGTVAMAANSIAMSIQSLSFMPGFGFGLAATALVGQNLGAEQPKRAEKSGFEALKFSMICALLMTVLFLFAPQYIAHLYTDDVEVLELTVICLRIIAIAMPFLGMIQVFSGGLRGAGDTRFVMFATLVGNWGIRLLGSYILGIHFGLGLVGVWIAMAGDQFGRGLLLLWRFKKGHWKNITIYEGDDSVSEEVPPEQEGEIVIEDSDPIGEEPAPDGVPASNNNNNS